MDRKRTGFWRAGRRPRMSFHVWNCKYKIIDPEHKRQNGGNTKFIKAAADEIGFSEEKWPYKAKINLKYET